MTISTDLTTRLNTALASPGAGGELTGLLNSGIAGSTITFAGGTGENLIVVPDNLAAALVVEQSTNAYLTVVTTDGSEAVVVSKDLQPVTITFGGTTGSNKISFPDNLADSLDFLEGTNSYLKFVTTNNSEQVVVGQHLAITNAKNVVLATGTGTQIGTAASQKLGFLGATPIVQRVGAAQDAVATTAATSTTPFGYAEAQANAIVTLVNELRAALVAFGLIKGAA